jgi:hypothetical protein
MIGETAIVGASAKIDRANGPAVLVVDIIIAKGPWPDRLTGSLSACQSQNSVRQQRPRAERRPLNLAAHLQ